MSRVTRIMKDSNRRNKSKKQYCSIDSVDDRRKARKFNDRGSYEVSRVNRFQDNKPDPILLQMCPAPSAIFELHTHAGHKET